VKRIFPALALGVAIAVVASVACVLTARWTGHQRMGHADAHHWIHTQLGLSAEQEKQLVPIEQRYDEQRRHFSELIRVANMELGQALLADEGDSPRVKGAIAKIQQAQGQLQDATLRHVFEMKPVLKPEQYQKLLNLTANALSQTDHAQ
jgi:Spy/CpxP family protein refolding chaperone